QRLRPQQPVRVRDDADVPGGLGRAHSWRHRGSPTRTIPPGATPAAGRRRGSAIRSTTVEPRLKAPSSAPRAIGIGAGGTVRAPGFPEFVTRSAKARLMRPTLVAPTMTTATRPNAGVSTRTETRSLTVKSP